MCKWNALALLVAGSLWQVGCAEPAPKPMTTPPPKPTAGQSGSTTGGGTEVPLPATKPAEEPKTETPAEPTPTPAEPTPAEPAPADAKPADPAAPTEGEKKPE
jgi:hypothetical protein